MERKLLKSSDFIFSISYTYLTMSIGYRNKIERQNNYFNVSLLEVLKQNSRIIISCQSEKDKRRSKERENVKALAAHNKTNF